MTVLHMLNAWAKVAMRNGETISFHKTLCFAFILLFLCVFGSETTYAQAPSIHWTDLDSFKVGYQVMSLSDTLAPDEKVVVNLYLENDSTSKSWGGWFDMEYASGVAPDPVLNHSIPDTAWLGMKLDMTASYTPEAGVPEAVWAVQRRDLEKRSGTGSVLTLLFEVGPDSIAVNSLVTSLGGGLIMVENVDFKRYPSVEMETHVFNCYPNPFRDRIQVACEECTQLRIWDIQGNLLRHLRLTEGEEVDLQAIPEGMYLVEGLNQDGVHLGHRRMIKR